MFTLGFSHLRTALLDGGVIKAAIKSWSDTMAWRKQQCGVVLKRGRSGRTISEWFSIAATVFSDGRGGHSPCYRKLTPQHATNPNRSSAAEPQHLACPPTECSSLLNL